MFRLAKISLILFTILGVLLFRPLAPDFALAQNVPDWAKPRPPATQPAAPPTEASPGLEAAAQARGPNPAPWVLGVILLGIGILGIAIVSGPGIPAA